MYRGDGIEARFISFAAGGGVAFIVGPLLEIAVTTEWRLFSLLAVVYAVVSMVVAYVWPQLGWWTGLWFFVFFPAAALASFFLGQGLPGWNAFAVGVFYYSWGSSLPVLVAGSVLCFGAGALLGLPINLQPLPLHDY